MKAERARPIADGASLLSARISADTRTALEEEAQRTGRSISQQADIWLREAATERNDLHGRLGRSAAATALPVLAAIARRVLADIGDPGADWMARATLLAAWRKALDRALPEAPPSAELRALASAADKLRSACAEVVEALKHLPINDPVRVAQNKERPTFEAEVDARLGHAPDTRAWVLMAEAAAGRFGRTDVPEWQRRLMWSCDDLEAEGNALTAEVTGVRAALSVYTVALEAERDQATVALARGRELAREVLPPLSGMASIIDQFSPE